MIPTPDSDPSGFVGLIAAAAGAILTAVVAFGVDLTADQITAILGVVSTVGTLTVAALIRRKAWAPDAHDAALDGAYRRGLKVGVHDGIAQAIADRRERDR